MEGLDFQLILISLFTEQEPLYQQAPGGGSEDA